MDPKTAHTLDGRTFAIGVLSITSCILFVGLLLVWQPPAQAVGMNDRAGDYILLTQQLSQTTEGVVVIDAAARRMIIYEFDYNDKVLNILNGAPLDQLPKPVGVEQRAPARR